MSNLFKLNQAFCDEVQAFITSNLDPETAATIAAGGYVDKAGRVAWEQALARKGWLAYTWPKELGGPGWTVMQQFLFEQITAEMNAPQLTPFGLKMVGPVIQAFASEELKKQHLPGILNSTTWWCQGYSEPGAGSDLASLACRAERRGDVYVINGQKIWTSGAHWADWMFALVRTSREGKRQEGISFILIDMKSPGIDVRPLIALDGHHGFNEVFFTDVEVPVSNLVGEEGKGWTYAKYLLSHERLDVVSLPEIHRGMKKLRAMADRVTPYGRLRDDPFFNARLIDVEVRTRAIESRVLDVLETIMEGGSPGPEVSGLKIRGTELSQDILELIMEASGNDALPFEFEQSMSPERPIGQPPDYALGASAGYMFRRAWTILGGSTEVQKNIMSKTLLALS